MPKTHANQTAAAAAAAKSLQSCPTLCNPIDGSPPGYPVPGVLQARTLEWVAISFFNAWKWKVKVKLLSRAWLLATPWTAAYQAPLSMGFSRQEYKLTNTKHKERILKAAREKQQATYKGNPICLKADLSAETSQARREWQIYLKYWKGKIYNQDYCTQQGSHSKSKEKLKAFQTSKS